MGIRTTVTLDDDVAEHVKNESRTRGATFRATLNDLLRAALLKQDRPSGRTLQIKPSHMGHRPGVDYNKIESLLEMGEGDWHR